MSPRAGESDAALISQSLARPQIFTVVFHRHYEAVHGYLARRGGVELADELTARTFTVAFERRTSFRAEFARSARPWLFGIATDLLRGEEYAERQALEELGHPGLGSALASLDADQRDALLLNAWEGLPYDEIAVALGVPLGTVRARLARARSSLRVALARQRGAQLEVREARR